MPNPFAAFWKNLASAFSTCDGQEAITPALRERCVEYVIRAEQGRRLDSWCITDEAEALATYIATGKKP